MPVFISRQHTFHLNIDPADSIDDEKLNVTAPTTAAYPCSPTSRGVQCMKIVVSACAGCSARSAAASAFHTYADATRPISKGGTVKANDIRPERIECACASVADRHDSTRWK